MSILVVLSISRVNIQHSYLPKLQKQCLHNPTDSHVICLQGLRLCNKIPEVNLKYYYFADHLLAVRSDSDVYQHGLIIHFKTNYVNCWEINHIVL